MRTQLRFAAGVCVLSTGLLIGSAGGAIAVADTDSSGSTAQSQDADGPSQGVSPASGPVGSVADTLRETVRQTLQDVTSMVGSLRKPGQRQSTVATRPTKEHEATDTDYDKNGSGVTPADPTPVASDSNVVAPAPNVFASSTDPVAPVSKVVAPVTNLVGSVATVAESVPAVVASLPSTATPVSDVITSVQDMLTSVADAVVPLTQLPSDLSSLLGVAGVDPAVNGVGAVNDAGLSAAAGAPVLAPQVLPISGIRSVPSAGNVAAVATLGGIATATLSQESSLSGMAPLAPHGVIPTGVRSFLEHTVSALLVPASLSALAAVALPGVGGLLILCAAGVRVGYRQAKAGLALRTAGIARFAGPGPLGVVRSGSLVALRPRALRVVRSEALREACLLDQVA